MHWPTVARPNSSTAPLQPRQCPRTCTELVGFDAESLEHIDKQIAQWRRAVGTEGQVLAVLEPTASNEDVKFFRRVTAAVALVLTSVAIGWWRTAAARR